MVMFGPVTPEKRLLIFVLLLKNAKMGNPADYLRTRSTELDQLVSFNRHGWGAFTQFAPDLTAA